MKKCLCVRGLKNSPFRVVCLLGEQRQRPVSEICCKDYLVCILYQGTAKQDPPFFFFLEPGSGCRTRLLRKDSSLFCCIPPVDPCPLWPPFLSLHSSSNLSLSSKKKPKTKLRLLPPAKNKGGEHLQVAQAKSA